MRSRMGILFAIAMTLAANAAWAEGEGSEASEDESSDGTSFGLQLTIGEGMYFIDGGVYRSPWSLELVPSIGWAWLKLDFGLSATLESIEIEGSNAAYWNFTFRPGARLTPPMIPLYLRVAFPLQFQVHDFDWGLMFGVGVDIHLIAILGIVFEIDTALTHDLEWGGGGVPLEFRAGVSLHF